MNKTNYPSFPLLHLRHSSFSKSSVALPTSQLILQPLFRFSYVTGSSLTSPGAPPMGSYHIQYFLSDSISSTTKTKWIIWQRCYNYSPIFLLQYYIIIRVCCPRGSPPLQAQKPKLQFCPKAGLHRKLGKQGSSFTKDLISAVASHCFPNPTLSLTSE